MIAAKRCWQRRGAIPNQGSLPPQYRAAAPAPTQRIQIDMPQPLPLTRQMLDRLTQGGCATPNCPHDHSKMYIHSVCHPKITPEILYNRDTGRLTIFCPECRNVVICFQALDWFHAESSDVSV